uniref:Uncharacterized protein n=1 Tax=Panagrolaimus sp. PS1159 TaxID=55785 RepID=A0AC35F8T2_9BILA
MILSKEFYDKCCPSYQKVIDELEKKLAEIEKCNDATEREKIFMTICQFSKRHHTPGEYWEYCLDCFKLSYRRDVVRGTFEKLRRDIIGHAYYHLYFNEDYYYIYRV